MLHRAHPRRKSVAEWATVHRGTTVGVDYSATPKPVTARLVRLNILGATDVPTIWEVQLFAREWAGLLAPPARTAMVHNIGVDRACGKWVTSPCGRLCLRRGVPLPGGQRTGLASTPDSRTRTLSPSAGYPVANPVYLTAAGR